MQEQAKIILKEIVDIISNCKWLDSDCKEVIKEIISICKKYNYKPHEYFEILKLYKELG